MYNLEKAYKQAKISRKEFEKIKKDVKKEFPNNISLYELHVLRYIKSLKRKTSVK
ncbi:MAG: hypothetical protein HY800_01525 [Ignavibacteriales bacterium]|nr:hypothetical protein [Ignavibacteriales bacterium]